MRTTDAVPTNAVPTNAVPTNVMPRSTIVGSWREFDRFDGSTTAGVRFVIFHEVADGYDMAAQVPQVEWFHRLRVVCEDSSCCPEVCTFSGSRSWEEACVQIQDLLGFLSWK